MVRPIEVGREGAHLVVKGWQGFKMTPCLSSLVVLMKTFEWYVLTLIFGLRRDVSQPLLYWKQVIVLM